MSRHALFAVPVVLLGAVLLSCTSPPPYSPMITPSPSMAPTAAPTAAPVATATPSNPISAEPTATPSAAASTSATASASPATSPTPSPTPSSAAVVSATTVSFKADVVPVLKNHCADCHTQGGRGSLAVLMFGDNEEPNFPVIRSSLSNMIRDVAIGRMPQGRPGTVPDADLQVLKDWQAAGSPNN